MERNREETINTSFSIFSSFLFYRTKQKFILFPIFFSLHIFFFISFTLHNFYHTTKRIIRVMEGETEGRLSIYKAARSIKRSDNTLYNALRSIYQDSIFVGEISQLWPQLPLLANLRCGLWYSSKFHATCYFKSTDGHTNNCSFNTSRLNLHVAQLAGTITLFFLSASLFSLH